jgi:hypothetical protein
MTTKALPFVFAILLLTPARAGAPLGYDPAEIGRIGVEIAMERDAERACQTGSTADPDMATGVDRRSEARLAQYFERIGGDDHSSVTHLFIDSGRMARWTGPEGSQPVKRKAFVVGNDAQTSRGVWVLAIPDAADPSKTDTYAYGVDFKLGAFGGM